MVQTCGNLRAVFRNGQLWIVTLTPSGVSVCSARVPARPIQATTRLKLSLFIEGNEIFGEIPPCLKFFGNRSVQDKVPRQSTIEKDLLAVV